MKLEKVLVLGLGYIGLPTASVLATHGFKVVGFDVNDSVVAKLKAAELHIDEPGLDIIVKAAIKSGQMTVASEVGPADVFIIAVPTPSNADHFCDCSYIQDAARRIAKVLKKESLVILESTSPPGTTEEVVIPILEKGSGLKAGPDFSVAHCPERVLPGRILTEIVENNRIIGGIDETSRKKARDLYARFVEGEIILTDPATAEMSKLVENTFRDVNIAFANQLSSICEQLGVNVFEVIDFANKHPRVNILKPGPGVGGHCLPMDPWFIVQKVGETADMISMARHINDYQPRRLARLVAAALKEVENPSVALWGLTYKENVDDIREAPANAFLDIFQNEGIEVRLHDPNVSPDKIPGIMSAEESLQGADGLVILMGHHPFKTYPPENAAKLMRSPLVFDFALCLNKAAWQSQFVHYDLGNLSSLKK